MDDERVKILEMLAEGKITVEQANLLLEALGQAQKAEAKQPPASEPEPEPSLEEQLGQWQPDIRGWAHFGRNLAEKIKAEVTQAMSGLRGGLPHGGGANNFSTMVLTQDYLEQMQDGSSFSNYGHLRVSPDVPEELLRAKIRRYSNFGATLGPEPLLRILRERCTTNFGHFRTGGTEEDLEMPAPPPPPAPPAPPAPAGAPMKGARAELTGSSLRGWSDWDFHRQYNELVVECHAGHLAFEGTEEDRLGLEVINSKNGGAEGWAGSVPMVARQEGSRLIFEIGTKGDPKVTQDMTFRFEVPEHVNVIAETAAGHIAAHELPGSIDFRTGGGNIRANDISGDAAVSSRGGSLELADVAGSVTAETAGGDVTVQDIAGNVSAQTAGGGIRARDIAGSVTLESGGGDLEVNDIAGGVTAHTGGGQVTLRDIAGNASGETGGGDVQAHDVSGNVTVGTGAGSVSVSDISGNVEAHTGAGDVRIHDISGSVTARTGAGNLDLHDIDGDATIHTGMGTVTLSDISGKVTQS